jgi:hypothetical protein
LRGATIDIPRITTIAELKSEMMLVRPHMPRPFVGASPEEIEAVKAAQKVDYLPPIYEEFLVEMGHSAGYFYRGEFYTVGRLLKLKDDVLEVMESDPAEPKLPDDAFVFRGHHGYEFLFFLTKGRDENPPIYAYVSERRVSGSGEPRRIWDTLLDHWNEEVQLIWEVEENMHGGSYRGKGAEWFTTWPRERD